MENSGDYSIRPAEAEELPAVLELMRENFYYEETIFRALSAAMTDAERKVVEENLDGTIRAAFGASPCLVAVDSGSGRIVGANVTAVSSNPKLGDGADGLCTIFASDGPRSPLVEEYLEYLAKIAGEADLFGRYPEAERMMEFYAVAVDKGHRQRGLAGKLLRGGISLARQRGIPLVFGFFTSMYSAKSAEAVGMRRILDIDLLKFTDGGKSVFSDTVPHNVVAVMVCEVLNSKLGD